MSTSGQSRGQGRRRRGGKKPTPTKSEVPPIQAFFARYNYDYSPQEETMEQFWDMVNEFGWGREDPERSNALDGVRDAIAMQFNEFYGGDVNDLVSWQALCQVLRMANIPETVDGCKSAIEGVFVNICDLVDYSLDNSRNLILHNNEVALSLYSRASGKIYPKDNAYAQGLLRYLLRRIFNPSATRGLVGGSGRGGRPGGRGRRL